MCVYSFTCVLQDELKAELAELEQEDLNERLMGADHVPVHQPAGATRISESTSSSLPNALLSIPCGFILIRPTFIRLRTETDLSSSAPARTQEEEEEAELKELQAALAM